jgi:RNA polymerase sigma factor (sigma-70 family)
MRSETGNARIFDETGTDDSSRLSETGLQRDLSEPKDGSEQVPLTVTIDPADHLNLARKVAAKFAKSEDYEELVSICFLALVKAAQKFDPSRGFEFSTYAYYAMRNAIFKVLKKKKNNRIVCVQLEGDVENTKTESSFEVPSGLDTNEEHIFRMRMMGYNHEEIKKRLSLSDTIYKKELNSLRRKILESQA